MPARLVTEILPVVAPAGTFTLTLLLLITVIPATETPPNLTSVAKPTFEPVMVTSVPSLPLNGVKVLITGGLMTKNGVGVKMVCVPSLTSILPLPAPAGTITVIEF